MHHAYGDRCDSVSHAGNGILTNELMNQPKRRGRPAKAKQEVIESPAIEDPVRVEIEGDVRDAEAEAMSLVRRVELETGRQHYAWGMMNPVDLVDAVMRVCSRSY